MAKRKKTRSRVGRRPGRRPSTKSKPRLQSKSKSRSKPKTKSKKPQSKPKTRSKAKSEPKKPKSKSQAKSKSEPQKPKSKTGPLSKPKSKKPPAKPKRKRKKKVEPKPPGKVMWRTVVSRGYIRRTEDSAGERLVYMGEVRATEYFNTEKEARAAVETLTANINRRLQNIYDISLWSKFQGKEPNVDVSAVSWNEDLIDLGEMIGDYEEEYEETAH